MHPARGAPAAIPVDVGSLHRHVRPDSDRADRARALALVGEDEEPLGIAGGDNRRSPGSDLNRQLDAARGVVTPALARAPAPPARSVPHHVSLLRAVALDGPPGYDADDAGLKVQSAYMAGVNRCYRDHRSADREAFEATVTFTINEDGHAALPTVTGLAAEAAGCIGSRVERWRFPLVDEPAIVQLVLQIDPNA